jgi:hypothetical protein
MPAAILPLITETISWNSLQEGINYCLQNHKACRNESTIELPPGFRVIDIEEQCIIQVATTTCDFFALSYVWGKDDSPHSKTTKANFFTLSIPGALSSVQLPQTVQDAMTACAQLGRRYLWVDRLCIIQDDLDDKAKQISAMDSIYRLAQYVMVAYGSKDMHSGISGISRPRPQTQMRVRFSGLTVTSDAFDDFCDRDFQGCDYLERGWTYQEFELARRKLCFRNTQAFLECRHGRKEEYHHGFGDLGDEDQTTRRVAPLFSQYTSHIEVYSRRRLTFYSDAIAAISGVLQWLYEGEGEILFGLPARHFDRALLWYHDPADLSRPPNSGFPSWSWAYSLGTRGNLKFRGALWRGHASFRSYEFCGTLIPWYAVSVDGSLRAINASTDDQICPKWRTYANIALKGGCVANSSCTLHDPVTVNERWPDHDTYIQAILSQNVTCLADLDVPGDLLQDSLIPKKGLLLTLAQTLTLNWKLNPFETDTGILLLSSTGNRIGEITLLLETQSQYNQLAALWGPTVEVMGISLAILTAPGGGKNWPPGKMVAVEGQEFPDIPVVNVLVIDREGICARRKHLGWVCLEDWVGSEKTWDYLLLS